MRAGVAAGHPATADVGAEILADGGTAADAVVAMALASCVAETVMSGLLAGCHAIVFDGSRVMNLDGFAAVPSGDRRSSPSSRSPFGDELVVYAIGPASCAVPGLPAALGELWERLGRLPWQRLCEPRSGARAHGSPAPGDARAHARDARRALRARARRATSSRATGARFAKASSSTSPGSCRPSRRLRRKVRASVYRGSIAEALLAGRRRRAHRGRPRATTARSGATPLIVEYQGRRVATRGGLSGVPELLPRLPRARRADARPSACSRSSTRSSRDRTAASTRRTWSPSTATGAPASSRTRSASARVSGSPASTRS